MKKIFLLAFLIFATANLYSQVPGVPIIISPADSATLCPPYIFDWNDVPTATSYKIQFSLNINFTALVIDEDLNVSQYTLPGGIISGATYCYWHVRASNSYGSSSYTPVRRVRGGTLLNPPVLLTPPCNSINVSNTPLFSYNGVGGATAYILQISKFPTFVPLIVCDTTPIGSIVLEYNTTYYWRMCSVGPPCGAGNWSSDCNFTTISPTLPPPTLLYPPNNSVNISLTPTLDWSDVAGATSYRVLITGILDTIVVSSELTIPPGKFNYYTIYYWKVSTVNIGGQGTYSSVWNFKTINFSGIHQISSEIPTEYKLYNNYPNPLNPSTNIKYQIPNSKFTTIKIFDILGKEIEILVNEKQSPGIYEVTFDGSNLPSGIYYYTIQAGDFTDTKKMVLIK